MSPLVRTILVRMPSSVTYLSRVEQLLSAWQDDRGFRLVFIPAETPTDRVFEYVNRFSPIHGFVCLEMQLHEDPFGVGELGAIPAFFAPTTEEHARWLALMGYSVLWDSVGVLDLFNVTPLTCPSQVWEMITDTSYQKDRETRHYLVICLVAGKDAWERFKVLEDSILDRPSVRVLPIFDRNVHHLSAVLSALRVVPDAVVVTHFDRRLALRDASRVVPPSTRLVLVMERVNFSRDWTGRYLPLISTGSSALPSYLAVGRFEDPNALCNAVGI